MWHKFGHSLENTIADEDYLNTALRRAFSTMTEREMQCFIMHYVCGNEQKDIGRALGGISQQAVSDNLGRAMGKASEIFTQMRIEVS